MSPSAHSAENALRPGIGIVASITASFVFAAMYFYSALLEPLGGQELYAWRILFTVPLLGVVLWTRGRAAEILLIVRRLRSEPSLWAILPATSALLGIQLWLFLWAPLNGHAMDVALGYFLLPLTLVLTGRWVFGERMSPLQNAAALLALAGVANEVARASSFAWPIFVVALGYPVYFLLRRKARTSSTGGLWLDMVLSLPFALAIVLADGAPSLPAALHGMPVALALLGLGLLSTAGLALFMTASTHLAVGLFGLLGYVEPVLLVGASLLLGERLDPERWGTTLGIGAAVMLLAADLARTLRATPHSSA